MTLPGTVAILGATSHIAKGLIERFLATNGPQLHLFTRSAPLVAEFLTGCAGHAAVPAVVHAGYGEFLARDYDVIINCVGVGTQKRLAGDFTRYFTVTEEYDNLALAYLQARRPQALYVSFSSGAVYGRGGDGPFAKESEFRLAVNSISREDYYGIARLNAEAKHRAFARLNIVDLRIFSYFSRHIDLDDSYFITELLRNLLHGTVLETDAANMVRDYLHPDDLFAAVVKCIGAGPLNRAYDLGSAAPVDKFTVLEHFAREHGLRYAIRPALENVSPTGAKTRYYAQAPGSVDLSCPPRYTSLETLIHESAPILRPLQGQ